MNGRDIAAAIRAGELDGDEMQTVLDAVEDWATDKAEEFRRESPERVRANTVHDLVHLAAVYAGNLP